MTDVSFPWYSGCFCLLSWLPGTRGASSPPSYGWFLLFSLLVESRAITPECASLLFPTPFLVPQPSPSLSVWPSWRSIRLWNTTAFLFTPSSRWKGSVPSSPVFWTLLRWHNKQQWKEFPQWPFPHLQGNTLALPDLVPTQVVALQP